MDFPQEIIKQIEGSKVGVVCVLALFVVCKTILVARMNEYTEILHSCSAAVTKKIMY